MKTELKKYLFYFISLILTLCATFSVLFLEHLDSFRDFINKIEQSSFDLRQNILANYKKADSNIVILAVDDESYEYITSRYGSWPISRSLWAYTIDNLEKYKPNKIIFDLLFVMPDLNDKQADNMLINSIKNNNNVYLSMNFDYTDEKVRKPEVLEDKFKADVKIKDKKILDNYYLTFTNVRSAMKELRSATDKIGSININRNEDGIIRNATPIYNYKNEFYPNLSLLVAQDILGQKQLEYSNNTLIIDKNHQIPLDETKRAILNWYGGSKTYQHISFWRVIEAFKNNNTQFLKNNFENKIIYIGATTTGLSDIKSVPVSANFSGVELNATFLNNILDNNLIKKSSLKVNIIISIMLAVLIGYVILSVNSVYRTLIFLVTTLVMFFIVNIYVMQKYNLWISLTIPYICAIVAFVLIYLEKYILKSKDYEQTYKLAVTDGLTQLYNHRYFQEQMLIQLNNYKRYQTPFSLIMIDIDFFKKFNDTYGHQSGDSVLQQVANILKKNIRTSDFACRYGGEEMSIILTNTDKKDAITTAQKICQVIRQTSFVLVNGQKVNVTISAGVASVNSEIEKTQQMIEYCDKCLYKAKENGRNQVVYEI